MVVGGGPDGPITNGMVMSSLDSSSTQPGWSCFGAAGDGVIPSGLPVAWAPGGDVTRYPAGTGLYLAQGHLLVMQIHYHLNGGDRPDQTAVKFELAEQVEKPGFVLLPDEFLGTAFGPTPAILPAGMSEVPFTWKVPVKTALDQLGAALGQPNIRLFLQGSLPHMHGYGKSMSVSVGREGEAGTCIADVFRWDFDWQRFYFYRDPIELKEDQILETTCRYDTSRATEPVSPGLGSKDEMCMIGLYVVADL